MHTGGREKREVSEVATRVLCIVLFSLIGVARPAAAGRNLWTQIGPDGGPVYDVVVDPSDAPVAYAATQRGVFKTIDGEHWRRLALDDYVAALAVDPQKPSTIYVGSRDRSSDNGYIRRSDDRGETWGDPMPVLDGLVVAIAIDPQDSRTLYVIGGRFGEVGVSRDGGATWASPTLAESLAPALAVDPRHAGTIRVAAQRGIISSTDYGSTWTLQPFAQSLDVAAFAVDPVDSNVMYVGAYYAGLFRSADGGITWIAEPDLARDTVQQLTPDGNGAAVYIGTDRGLFRARSGSEGVERVGLDGHSVQSVAVAGATHYAAIGSGVERSDDGGATWEPASSGLGSAPVSIATGLDGTLYARSDGVFRSTDHGRSWTLSSIGLNGFVTALATHPGRADTVYAGTDHGVFVSQDRAATWQRTGLVFDPPPYSGGFEVRALAIDPADPARLYAGTWEGLYVSGDGGETWQRVQSQLLQTPSVSQIAIAANGTVYAAVDGARSLFVSSDLGVSWRLRDRRGGEFTALTVDPHRPDTLYAGRRFWYGSRHGGIDGLYVSRNGGRTWSMPLVGAFPETINAVAVDAEGRIFAATWSKAYRSDDGGTSWQSFTAGLPDDVDSFAFAVDRPGVVYAGSGEGVFEVEMVQQCRGDCNGDGAVHIDELIRLVNAVQAIGCPIAPNCPPADACLGVDIDGDGEISTDELVAGINRVVEAVDYSLNGCP